MISLAQMSTCHITLADDPGKQSSTVLSGWRHAKNCSKEIVQLRRLGGKYVGKWGACMILF